MSEGHDYRQTPAMRLLRALVEAHDAMIRWAASEHRQSGLSNSEFDCLATLGEARVPLRMCDLAARSLLTKSRTTQVMKEMEARGLARRERSRANEREVLVSLTPAGQELFDRVYPLHYERLKALLDARLDASEQEAATAYLRRLTGGE